MQKAVLFHTKAERDCVAEMEALPPLRWRPVVPHVGDHTAVDDSAEVLHGGNAQQADELLRLRAEAMQLQAVAAENTRLQAEMTRLHKVRSTNTGEGHVNAMLSHA